MDEHDIIVNRDYQRTNKVWPTAARSYLIDTLLHGFPMPKMSLRQVTDVRTRRTYKEIVDGQQRSQVILDFYSNKLRISGRDHRGTGSRYSELDEENQNRFLSYPLSVDLYVGATDAEIREVFRRINSYTVPLNPQEKRHAVWQGCFKWFVATNSSTYAQCLKEMGVFSESQLSRMSDSVLISEFCMSLAVSVFSASDTKLEEFYKSNDLDYPASAETQRRIDAVFGAILGWPELHRGPLMRSYNFLTLALAVTHIQNPCDKLQELFPIRTPALLDERSLLNLSVLAEAVSSADEAEVDGPFTDFVLACSEGTNRLKQRQTRFRYFCRALTHQLNQ